ncbi:MAG: class I SAM-dependent methyltransferase [Candidatus Pacearchaeota archaeon]|nr:MAG: class I SAM-dependent methyltransferase [Candidatus Pacearchaeota archaeon]
MISLSREWISVSKAIYGQEFIDELAEFLRQQKVKIILECGCGGGHILHGLVNKGFYGLGIDSNKEMINHALRNYKNLNIKYKQMNWLNIDELKENFDAVICRGNSLVFVTSWEKKKQDFDPNVAKDCLVKSINKFFEKIRDGGLLYVDTISQIEINNNGGPIEFKTEKIQLKGKIEYDWKRRIRYIYGGGKVNGKEFYGSSTSYLITPKELEDIIKTFNPSAIWTPELVHEKDYHVICARK